MSQGMWLKTNERIYLDDSTCPESLKIEGLARYKFATKYVHGKTVLDVACGSGYGSNMLKNFAKEVYGVDYSREAVKYAKEFYRDIAFLVASAEYLPFKEGVFDTVVSFETIEHLRKPEKFVEDVKRILKGSGGLTIISTPWLTEDYKFHSLGNHIHSFNFKFLDEILSCFPIRKYLSQVQSTNFTNLHFPSYIIALCAMHGGILR